MKKMVFVLLIIFLSNCSAQDSMDPKNISYRPPTVAGAFYPDKPEELKQMIKEYLGPTDEQTTKEEIYAIISPHAGYVFSGPVAGRAYRELAGRKYDLIVIIGPTHVKAFRGASVYDGDAYVTPLGNAIIDRDFAKKLSEADPVMKYSIEGHDWKSGRGEHSIEVQIPFLQVVLPGTPIVPICMGSQDFATADGLMKAIYKTVEETGKKILIVASSDLSHFHDEETAHSLDSGIVNAFNDYDYFSLASQLFTRRWEACGGGPIVAALMASEQLGANMAKTVKYATSADVPEGEGSKNRVVGYFSGIVYHSEEENNYLPKLSEEDKKHIFASAKLGVRNAVFGDDEEYKGDIPDNLNKSYATFVTITKKGKLRGCMGHIYSNLSLMNEIKETSRLASQNDYRFGPVKEEEMNDLEYEVTILSRLIRVADTCDIEIGRDGLYLKLGRYSGLLLPQVASERGWDATTFLENLSIKAGLNTDAYKDPEAQLYSFRAIIIHE